MKIIKKGTPRDEVVWRGTCNACDSVIQAKRDELLTVEYDHRENGEFGRASCPVCHYGMIFYPKKGK